MKRRILLISVLSLIFSFNSVDAQTSKTSYEGKGTLRFREEAISFGKVKEEGGDVHAVFRCFNIGKFPVVISNVKTSCGCTVSDWSRDTIAPGDSGYVIATFDPRGQVGTFEKGLFVYNNGVPYEIFLTIDGEVLPRPKTVEDNYPSKFGKLMMSSNYFNLGFVYKDEIDTAKAKIYNASTDTIRITGVSGRPPHILMKIGTSVIPPKTETEISFIYNAKETGSSDYGSQLHYLQLLTDDPQLPQLQMHVQAEILERFPKQTKRRIRKNPEATFEIQEQNYGKAVAGDTVVLKYKLTNTGKRPLKIRRIYGSCGCTATSSESNELKAGESTYIVVRFNTSGRSGQEDKTVTVITNDPAHAIAKLILKGEVVQNPNSLQY